MALGSRSIPMGALAGQGTGQNQINPFETLSTLANVQRTMLDVQTRQRELDATKTASEIMSMYPDLDSGLTAVRNSPGLAPWIPQFYQTMAETQRSMALTRQTGQQMANTSLGTAIHMLGSIDASKGLDNAQWDAIQKTGEATLGPQELPAYHKLMGSLYDVATDNGMTLQGPKLANNIMGLMAGGISPEAARMWRIGITGEPGATSYLPPPSGEAPTYGAAFGPGGGGYGTGAPASTGPLGMSTRGGLGGPAPAPGAAPVAAGPTGPVVLAGDGTPMLPDPQHMPAGFTPPNIPMAGGGGPATNTALGQQSADMSKQFSDERTLGNYAKAQDSLSNLAFMRSSLDRMQQSGSFLAPGPGAEGRLAFAARINQITGFLGMPNAFSPEAVASGTDFMRQSRVVGINALTSLLGNQREAASTIDHMIATMPSVNNTYLGGMMLLQTIGAQVERSIEMRQFQGMYQARYGTLVGSPEMFAQLHPSEHYMIRALDEIHMGPNMTTQDVHNFYKSGVLGEGAEGEARAKAMLKNEFDNNGHIRPRSWTGGPPIQFSFVPDNAPAPAAAPAGQ